jgi:hypothetical protein
MRVFLSFIDVSLFPLIRLAADSFSLLLFHRISFLLADPQRFGRDRLVRRNDCL